MLRETIRTIFNGISAIIHYPAECIIGCICLVFVRLYLTWLSREGVEE